MASNGCDAPVVGITTYVEQARYGVWQTRSAVLPWTYVDAVVHAGGIPVLLPPVSPERTVQGGEGDERSVQGGIVARIDGLVLSGGADIDPGRYGQAPHERAGKPSLERDDFEFALFEQARAVDLPVFAVCRGVQLVNVALGGTLLQHLPDRLEHDIEHLPTPGVFGTHRVSTAAGSRVAGIVGGELKVRCHHHQAIDRLADGLRATAFAEDGTIEAVEGAGLLGVQWHPEEDEADARLFATLIDDARRYREERTS